MPEKDNNQNNLRRERLEREKQEKEQLKVDKKQLKADLKAQKKEEKQRRKDIEERQAELNGDDSGGFATLIITLLIILIWLVIMALLIKMDIGGFGSNILAPIIRDVPYLNVILPESARVVETTEEVEVSDDASEGSSEVDSLEQANAYIRRLENELRDEMEQNSTYAATINRLEAEVDRLEPFEEEQAEFEKEKAEFYENIVYGEESPDASAFASYYEMIEPEVAASIYAAIVQEEVDDDELEEYIKTYSSMKPKAVAAIFDVLIESDIDLVTRILDGMSAETRGDILTKMDETNASLVTKKMEPGQTAASQLDEAAASDNAAATE